jgi:hypothetical protein
MLYFYTVLYEPDDVAAVKVELARLPPAARTKLTAKEVVAALGAEVRGLREKRFAWDHIVALLSERGITLSRWTLQKYLRLSAPVRRRRRPSSPVATSAPPAPPAQKPDQPAAIVAPLAQRSVKAKAEITNPDEGMATPPGFPKRKYNLDEL